MLKKISIVVTIFVLFLMLLMTNKAPDFAYRILPGYFADPDKAWTDTPLTPASITQSRLPEDVIRSRTETRLHSSGSSKQILFGDTHIHTTNSADAFMYSLPMMHGASGAYPPAFACDYARFISQLDFYFLTDHAESFTLGQWQDGIESVRPVSYTHLRAHETR